MTKATILTATVAAIVLSVMASQAAVQPAIATALKSACETQIWPNISSDCLLTISGEKADLTVRVVSSDNS